MNSFFDFIRLGYQHITHLAAIDHILFIVVLMAVYQTRNWLKIIIAVSFFTIGHSISLTLSAFELITINVKLIEFLIPLTIAFVALFNLTKSGQNQNSNLKNILATGFGLIHGFGFSNYYSMLVLDNNDYWTALIPFNIGVELGQLLVVGITLIIMFIFQYMIKVKSHNWNLFISGCGFAPALLMCIENWPW